jgi:hypothetical protein
VIDRRTDVHDTVRRLRRAVSWCVLPGMVAASAVHAQRAIPQTLRDSAAALLADSLLDAALDDALLLPRHRVSVRAVARRYDFAGANVREQSAPLAYAYDGTRVALRASGTPLSLTAPGGTVSGASPVRGRLAVRVGRGDTIEVHGNTASAPGALSMIETAVLGSIATSTVDLEAMTLGTAAAVGTRGVLSVPLGGATVGTFVGVELQPRPQGSTPVFWRGRTLTAGASVAGDLGLARLAVRGEWSRSWADSLDGRNLFPGGGFVSLLALLDGPLDTAGRLNGSMSAFWSRPYANARADQPNRLVPQGSVWGLSGQVQLETGRVSWLPMLSLLRESSAVDIGTAQQPSRLTSSAWTASAGTALEIPLTRAVSLAPEVGVAWGSVDARTTTMVRTRRGRTITVPRAVDDPLGGSWIALAVQTRW